MSIWDINGAEPDYEANQEVRTIWFNKIAPAGNWKGQIDTWIDRSDYEECANACVHFTGSVLEITDEKGDKVRVYADGYYVAIGA